jgi:hypothetical protein
MPIQYIDGSAALNRRLPQVAPLEYCFDAWQAYMIKITNEQANQLALKQQFVDRAKALSKLAEALRCQQVTLLICETVAFGVRAEAEIFQAAYGDPAGRRYWDAHLSEPISIYSFAHVLSAHLAEKVEQLELARIAIIRALRDAAEAGERCFTGETSSLLAMEDGQTNFENLGKLKVNPRAAVEWLLSKPKREHLIPDSLRGFLQSGEEPSAVPRPVTEKIAERFVAIYISGEQAAGRRPTLTGLEAAAKKAGLCGGREHLRAAFHQSPRVEVRRGRPTKFAEK